MEVRASARNSAQLRTMEGMQSPWPLTDESFDFLGEFAGTASLDLLTGPAVETVPLDFQCNDITLQAASDRGSAGSGSCFADPELNTRQVPQKASTKELNKAAQKRFREKQKVNPLQTSSHVMISNARIVVS